MDVLDDFRHARRLMRRQPLVSGIAILTLGVGIGATTAMFAVLQSVLWRPLSYDPQGRLVTVLENEGGRRRSPTSPANFRDWSASRTLEAMTAAHPWSPTLTGRERADKLVGLKATPGLFTLLETTPLLGRTFTPADGTPDRGRVVVLGYSLWQRRFGGDRDILGRRLVLDGEPYDVIGVMPEGFSFPPFWHTGAELWTPLVFDPAQAAARGARMLRVFARLREGSTLEEAQAELRVLHDRLVRAFPDDNSNTAAEVEPLLEPTVGDARTTLLIMLGAVGFVLLIACANVAGLLLARASAQSTETAMRLALGAGGWRIVRQHLAHGLVLAAAGGVLGVLVSSWAVSLSTGLDIDGLPRAQEIAIDTRVLAFATSVLVATGLLVTLAPAAAALKSDILPLLRGGGERGSSAGGFRGRMWLVSVQLALAAVLLVGTGLLLRSVWNMQAADPGFARDHVLTLTIDLPRDRYADAERQARVLDEARDRIAQVPGVDAAGFVNHLPVAGDTWGTRLVVDGAPLPAAGAEPRAVFRVTTPGYFDAAGIRRIAGRDFSTSDRATAPPVVIVNRTFARQYLGGEALGRRVSMGGPDERRDWRTVIGVVADIRQGSMRDPVQPEMYLPFHQNPVAFYTSSSLVVRVRGDASTPRRAIEDVLAALEPDAPITQVRTIEQVLAGSMRPARLSAGLFASFGLVSVALASIGLYGVVATSVRRRTRELGIRIALGADRSRLVRLVLAQAVVPVAVGGLAGLAASRALAGTLAGSLYGVTPADLATYAAVTVLLVVVSLAATAVPAVRASRLNPIRALHDQS